jgi:hypothetical protein
MSEDMDDIYKKLCNKAGVDNNFSFGEDYVSKKSSSDSSDEMFKFKMWYIYIVFPVLVFIILWFNKPCFVTDTLYDNAGRPVQKINFNKTIMYSFILGILIDLGIYGMFLRKCKK